MAFQRLVFPAAAGANLFSMTLLMVVLGVLGYGESAADVGLIQGALLAVFLGFSANARNLILSHISSITALDLLRVRFILLPLMLLGSAWLVYGLTNISLALVAALVLRRALEWVAEIQLCQREAENDIRFGWAYLLLQGAGFSALLLGVWKHSGLQADLSLWFWVVSPALIRPAYYLSAGTGLQTGRTFRAITPHFASSWMVALSTFFFRIIVVMLAGKALAGTLLSAYALGGMLVSMYTYVVGPGLVRREDYRSRIRFFCAVSLCFLGGVGLTGYAYKFGDPLTANAEIFLPTVGLSLLGCAPMLIAQRWRAQILQNRGASVFVQDVLINLVIVVSPPFAVYVFGDVGLASLFLWGAAVNFLVYLSSHIVGGQSKESFFVRTVCLQTLLGVIVVSLLLSPVFFQFGDGISLSPDKPFDGWERPSELPLPLSVLACALGLLIFSPASRANLSATVIFLTFLILVFSLLVSERSTQGMGLGNVLLLVQTILPFSALMLGQSFAQMWQGRILYETVLLYVLVVFVPLSVAATLFQRAGVLTSNLFLFSVYQHLQYVPVVAVGAYCVSWFALSDHPLHCRALLLLAPFMGIYIAASLSSVAVAVAIGGVVLAWWILARGRHRLMIWVTGLSLIGGFLVYQPEIRSHAAPNNEVNASMVQKPRGGGLEWQERVEYWYLDSREIVDEAAGLWFGHGYKLPSTDSRRGHNYFLDVIYHFGVLAVLPLVGLLLYTLAMISERGRGGHLTGAVLGLSYVVLALVLVDNSVKAGLRQPYSGIFTFFLWGVLLARLEGSDPGAATGRDVGGCWRARG